MLHYFPLLFLLFSSAVQAQQTEELVIFVQPNTDSEFTTKSLRELEILLKEQNIGIRYIDVTKQGAPKEVGYTPFLVYRNHLGRKVYKGRYTTKKRLLNFIRTVRRLPEAPINYQEDQVFVWEYPKAALLLKPKITTLSGSIPPEWTPKTIKATAIKSLEKGLALDYQTTFEVRDHDELFYTNYYPYRAEDGSVYISMELYSHYDCHTPIYQQYDNPVKGVNLETAFEAAAQTMRAEIQHQLEKSEAGDAMHFLTHAVKTATWDALQLPALDRPKQSSKNVNVDLTLPKNWRLLGPVETDMPILTFSFPAPLRHYGGELKAVKGNIQLPQANQLTKAQGDFTVETASIQMGQAELDDYVKGSVLSIADHPTATLSFKAVVGDKLELQLGRITTVEIKATLTMLNKTSPVTAVTQFEPFIDQDGALRLYVSTQFTAYDLLGNYAIEGPDGPAEANNQLLFIANFVMEPADTKK